MRAKRLRGSIRTKSPWVDMPFGLAMECQLVLQAYYGGRLAAAWFFIKSAFHIWKDTRISRALMWFSDLMGWTKVYDIPETPDYAAHQQRHGRFCSGSPNCNNDRCIEQSCPNWFRKILDRHNS